MAQKLPLKRTLVVGDIQGAFRSFMQVLERAEYNPEEDKLICLGNLVGPMPESSLVLETLIDFKEKAISQSNFHYPIILKGQNDIHFSNLIRLGLANNDEVSSGLVESYYNVLLLSNSYIEKYSLFITNRTASYFIDTYNRLYVHGGIKKNIYSDSEMELASDTQMWKSACEIYAKSMKGRLKISNKFDKIFLGNKEDHNAGCNQIHQKVFNIINLDSGPDHEKGKLTIMDAESEQFYTSDMSVDLYPELFHKHFQQMPF